MINYKEVQKTEEEIISIRCDVCGKVYDVNDVFEIQEFRHIRFYGGYGSVFGDGTKVSCDICQHCLYKMIGDFCKYDDELSTAES